MLTRQRATHTGVLRKEPAKACRMLRMEFCFFPPAKFGSEH